MKLLPGSPTPLGATWDGEGVNFAIYSEHATSVELCLFDEAGSESRAPMPHRTAFVWHAYAPEVRPGQRYGYRVHGPYEPARGLRFNAECVLLDPYAKAVDGIERWDEGCFAYELGASDGDARPSTKPQLGVPRGVVVDSEFDWEGDEPLRTPLHRSVIYEAHVRGLTKLHPEVPEGLRGTYAGVAHPAVIRHLRDLGITAIELMPIHAFVDDKMLVDRGLRNYWGYSTIGFFAPDVRYRSAGAVGSEVREFKEMVKALHRAGIEVILDVVYNHTAEGNHLGPTFNFKGIDNPTYYRLVEGDPRYYFDYTGTGNTLNVRHPQVLALVMDSLRYWASEMHVDGFRFDLASALARQLHEVDQLSSFFTLIHQSPTLGQVKLIAEPWDVGEGGYQVGNFPVRWAEWNGRYRDAVRALWRGDGGKAGEIGFRLTGSSDLYQSNGRLPSASINLITAHDGFTLDDLVTYDHKHNEANGEDNRDGNDNEHAWNCGAEGPTEDASINTLRRRQRRNLLATLLLSQGTPMFVAGDEFGRSQRGNNNAYCQDNEISWVDWNWSAEQRALFEFSRRLLRIRREHPALHRSKFFQGRPIHGTDLQDLHWFRSDGARMSEGDWSNPHTQSMAMFLGGRAIDDVDENGRPLVDDNLLLFINASSGDLTFKVPTLESVRESWQLLIDTSDDAAVEVRDPGGAVTLVARSLKLFRAPSRVIRAGGAHHTLGATYRLQMTPQFGFAAAHAIIDYLGLLGVTDVYASPIFAAGRGSNHGYDVIDHGRLNDELGTQAEFEAWTDALRAAGIGLVLDWVPNHMGIADGGNKAWTDVLENGPSSIFAESFDIDWNPPKQDLQGRVLLPILGEQYGDVLERGELRVIWESPAFVLAYFDRRLPIGPKTFVPLLNSVASKLDLGSDDPARLELESIVTALGHMPDRRETSDALRRERAREKEVAKRRLAALIESSPEVFAAVESALVEVNGAVGSPTSFDGLDALLQAQSYRLASWRVAVEEINYRRFFDVNDLAALRMESPEVFDRAHDLLFRLLTEQRVQAVRLDHTDGLYDPDAYFEALQRRFLVSAPADGKSPDDVARPIPLLVEKILEPGEQLPSSWPVDGTTGYDFTSAVEGLWVDPASEASLTAIYRRFTGDGSSFSEHVYQSKEHILRYSLASEINMLARSLERIAGKNRKWRDFTLISLTRALSEVIAAFEVYRTYFRDGQQRAEHDEKRVRDAIRIARRRNPSISRTIFAFLEDVLLLRTEGTVEDRRDHVAFALRFQQLTGPVMAKSVEDTAFYRYGRLLCLNEVGGSPAKFGTSPDEFHEQNRSRARSWPLAMTTTSTHDTKRGEDAAARIAVLTEMPDLWRRTVRRWGDLLARFRVSLEGERSPSPELEYQFYQTLVGAWPFGWDGETGREDFAERMAGYLLKASKEAKQQTSWTTPNVAYDEAVQSFGRGALADDAFLKDARGLCESIGTYAAANALGQCLLRLCSPGVPDTYQGSELWNQRLVDPDNRSAVDYALRRRMLELVRGNTDRAALIPELLGRFEDGAIKLWLTHLALDVRRKNRELFLRGDYMSIAGNEHVVAFTRTLGASRLVCCTTRFSLIRTGGSTPWAIGEVWGDERIAIPVGRYRNELTGATVDVQGEVRLRDLFAELPMALLLGSS